MSAPMPGPEVFDVVIFGASGFTGKYVIREALKFLSPNASPLRTLALAGRSRERVAAALSWAASPGPVPDVPILVADASDPASLATVAARARVLLSCAGPFRLHGRQVAAACAEAGAHCLDISGEPEFMERVEADLHEVAAKNGSLIVSACGFASTVADLGFLFHSRQWTPPSAPVSVVAYVNLESSDRKIVGNFATFESAVLGVANTSQLQALRRSRPRPAKPSIPGPPPPKGSLMIEHDKALGLWAMKLPSADTVVVKRTLAKVTEHPEGLPCADETSDFEKHKKEFWSSIKPAHFGVKIGSRSILGLVWCLSTAIFVGILAGFSFGRSLLLNFPEFFSLGFFRKTGPTEAEVSSASFKTWFVGRGYINSRHASECSPDKEIVTRVSGPEIGYITTSIILIQCALVLLSQRANLPKGGVYTPGVVFGPTDLQKRLEENGLSFDLISTRTIPSDEQAHAS